MVLSEQVASLKEFAQGTFLGQVAIAYVAFILVSFEVVSTEVAVAFSLYTGFPLLFQVANRLSKSTGLDNSLPRLPRSVRGVISNIGSVIVFPFVVFVLIQVFISGRSLSAFTSFLAEFGKGLSLFIAITVLYRLVSMEEDFQDLRFHWQLLIVLGVASMPLILIAVWTFAWPNIQAAI